jgi:hypothetical protein
MNEGLESASKRLREMLESHAAQKSKDITETVDGKVSVTVDSRLQVTAVRLLDQSIDDCARVELERAIAEAVNVARRRAVLSTAGALTGLRESSDWKASMDEIFKGKGAT